MSSFCNKCEMSYDGSNCPICHGKTKTNAKTVAASVVIVGVVFLFGILLHTGEIEINHEKLDETLQSLPQNIEDAGKTTEEIASETTIILREAISEQLTEDHLKSIDKTFDEMAQIPKEIQEKSSEIQKEMEEDQIKRDEQQRLENENYLKNITVRVHELVNEERTSRGLSSLSWNEKIAQAALNHSNDMAARGYFEHDTPEGLDFTDRYSQVGFNCMINTGGQYSLGGENIMYMDGYYGVESVAKTTVDGWMNSPGHRDNMLTSHHQSQGIGVAESGSEIYVTQDFC